MRYKYYKSQENNSSELIDKGYLQISTYGADIGYPIDNATIKVISSGGDNKIIEEFKTNSSGKTPKIDLPTPPLEFSMNSGQPKPYSSYDVLVEMSGYDPVTIRGVQVFPEVTACQNINLESSVLNGQISQNIEILEPVLWGDFPPKIAESPIKVLPPTTGFVVLSKPVVPEFMVVHEGAPTNTSGKNHWIPFKDYIKNVASCEIYSTWPENTLRANVMAIISFALNRVFTEWYRSRGYDFTITNSTSVDQAFNFGRNIFQEISDVVDDVFTTFITKPGIRQPLLTQYCDGKKVTCPNWMPN